MTVLIPNCFRGHAWAHMGPEARHFCNFTYFRFISVARCVLFSPCILYKLLGFTATLSYLSKQFKEQSTFSVFTWPELKTRRVGNYSRRSRGYSRLARIFQRHVYGATNRHKSGAFLRLYHFRRKNLEALLKNAAKPEKLFECKRYTI